MSNLTASVLSDLESKLSTLGERESKLRAELAAIESERTEANGLILTIKAGSVKGFEPPKVAPVKATSAAIDYRGMTVRTRIRTYFAKNGNKPRGYREIAKSIGSNPSTVACTLSMSPEFVPGIYGWTAHPTWLSNGWVMVGR